MIWECSWGRYNSPSIMFSWYIFIIMTLHWGFECFSRISQVMSLWMYTITPPCDLLCLSLLYDVKLSIFISLSKMFEFKWLSVRAIIFDERDFAKSCIKGTLVWLHFGYNPCMLPVINPIVGRLELLYTLGGSFVAGS